MNNLRMPSFSWKTFVRNIFTQAQYSFTYPIKFLFVTKYAFMIHKKFEYSLIA